MHFLHNDLKEYIDQWPKDNASKIQRQRWPEGIRYQLLGQNHPNCLRLLQEEGYDGEPVFSVSQSTVNKFLNPDIDHPLYPNVSDLLRFAVFFNLDLAKTIHLILKMYFEKNMIRLIKKQGAKLYSYYDINKHTKQLEENSSHFSVQNLKNFNPDELYAQLTNRYHYFVQEDFSTSDLQSLIQQIISEHLLPKPNHQVNITFKSHSNTPECLATETLTINPLPLIVSSSPRIKGSIILAFTTVLLMLIGIFSFLIYPYLSGQKSRNHFDTINFNKLTDIQKKTLLIKSAEQGDIALMQLLLNNHTSPNSKDNEENSALNAAAHSGQTEAIKLLLRRGADVNVETRVGWTPLISAADQGYLSSAKLLLDNGANPNAVRQDGWTALMSAAHNNHSAIIQLLIDYGAKVDAGTNNHWTALMSAAGNGNVLSLKRLLTNKANPNLTRDDGWSALMAGVNNGSTEIVNLLLEFGANPNQKTQDGWTALHQAAETGRDLIVRKLISYGANPNPVRKDNFTPLMAAVNQGHLQVVQTLLSKGARKDIRLNFGQTALDLAKKNGDQEMIQLLK